MVKNPHKVPKSQWRKWNDAGKGVFNYAYGVMRNQKLFSHPEALEMPTRFWNTTRWNAAWIAADAATEATKR